MKKILKQINSLRGLFLFNFFAFYSFSATAPSSPAASCGTSANQVSCGSVYQDISIKVNSSLSAVPSCVGATSFSISPSIPEGLIFNTSNGSISGVAKKVQSKVSYTVTASNSSKSFTFPNFTIEVTDQDLFCKMGYGAIYAMVNASVLSETPMCDGGPASFVISPALPNGLKLDPILGTISGASKEVKELTTYTVTVSNAKGQSVNLNFPLKIEGLGVLASIGKPDKSFVLPGGSITYPVTYLNSTNVALDVSGLKIVKTGTADCANVIVTGGSTTTPQVTFSGCTGVGTVGFTLKENTAFNSSQCGNSISAPSEGIGVVLPPPDPTIALKIPSKSPSTNTTPTLTVGNLIAGEKVELYPGDACTGEVVATGTAGGTSLDLKVSKPLSTTPIDQWYYFTAKVSNAFASVCTKMNAPYRLDTIAPWVYNISDDLYSLSDKKSFIWDTSEANCSWRYTIDRSPTATASKLVSPLSNRTVDVSYGQIPGAVVGALNETVYLHVQAIDEAGNIGPIKNVAVKLWAPNVPRVYVTNPRDWTYDIDRPYVYYRVGTSARYIIEPSSGVTINSNFNSSMISLLKTGTANCKDIKTTYVHPSLALVDVGECLGEGSIKIKVSSYIFQTGVVGSVSYYAFDGYHGDASYPFAIGTPQVCGNRVDIGWEAVAERVASWYDDHMKQYGIQTCLNSYRNFAMPFTASYSGYYTVVMSADEYAEFYLDGKFIIKKDFMQQQPFIWNGKSERPYHYRVYLTAGTHEIGLYYVGGEKGGSAHSEESWHSGASISIEDKDGKVIRHTRQMVTPDFINKSITQVDGADGSLGADFVLEYRYDPIVNLTADMITLQYRFGEGGWTGSYDNYLDQGTCKVTVKDGQTTTPTVQVRGCRTVASFTYGDVGHLGLSVAKGSAKTFYGRLSPENDSASRRHGLGDRTGSIVLKVKAPN